MNDYSVWYILTGTLSTSYVVRSMASVRLFLTLLPLLTFQQAFIRRVAEFFLRPAGNSPYDAYWGPGNIEYSPIVVCSTIHARQILTGRDSYVKAFVIHSRGVLNPVGCHNNCAHAVRGTQAFYRLLLVVSLFLESGNGACSNCVWTEHGALWSAGQGAPNGGGGGALPGPRPRTGGRAIRCSPL
ncbi:hypothetical protein AG0111_0g12975 [Alternaria gaisen]|uniref:Uncharacterized protein n=1 Tax=Alternaria gaisen TaxID=167740 RepID=A0ACB6F2V0_9PLEO|nr:hypothetical protein AG0111_0g12975 [Alternaria gaisen]